ncbi:hypothetical protein J8V57_01370 [Xenorhabdus sp. PB61.4]|uniref:hypothetical protein n=1 Tax=Xenorhabdus sp. PB61.4 TaxID=2788940 RepID=UPI001E5E2FD9|nr:hypothetical protein [Xenorhabdus sp. PB61.4]MCC8364940.1 hypothetical protein [Xenorhabdus sp. PB61.4]
MMDVNPIVFYTAIFLGMSYQLSFIFVPTGLLFGFLALKVFKKIFVKILFSIMAAGLLIPPILGH